MIKGGVPADVPLVQQADGSFSPVNIQFHRQFSTEIHSILIQLQFDSLVQQVLLMEIIGQAPMRSEIRPMLTASTMEISIRNKKLFQVGFHFSSEAIK